MSHGASYRKKGLVCPKCGMTAPEQPIKSAIVSHNCPVSKHMVELVVNNN